VAENQAFRWGERAYGVQFHLEVTAEMVRQWSKVPAYRSSLSATLGEVEGSAFLTEAEARAGEMHPTARRLIANWLDLAETSV
jgi:GMP synthase (glutamine-hydrolysing)